MDRRLLLAIALSALVVIAYQQYLQIFYPQRPAPGVRSGERPTPQSVPGVEPAPTGEAPPALPPPATPEGSLGDAREAAVALGPDVHVETEVFEAAFSATGGRLVSLVLKDYRASIEPGSPGFQLVSPRLVEPPLGIVLRGQQAWTDVGVRYEPSESLRLAGEGSGTVTFRGKLPQGGNIEKRFTFRGNRFDFEASVRVEAAASAASELGLTWVRTPGAASSSYSYEGIEALVGKKLRQFDADELGRGVILPDPKATTPAPVRWAAYADTYFLSALVPLEETARLWVKRYDEGPVTAEMLVPISAASEGASYVVYAGPKDIEILDAAGHDLSRAVNLGWFGLVAEPMLRALKLFHRITGNYGLDIIFLTMLIKVLFIPLTHKSFQSMQQLQKLQPEMKKLQERFAEDRERLNKEVMELYRRHKVNPLGGCLPMLFQLPIFVGLYNALLSAVELRHAPFALWINDLSAPDRLPAVPNPPFGEIFGYEARIPVLTILMGASMLVQQKMAPPAGDPAQQRIMMLMPLIFTFMFLNFPSGLVLYWLVNNVLTIAQQAWMLRGRR